MAFARSEIESYFQSLRHKNDLSNDYCKNNTLANVLWIDWMKGKAEQLTQLEVITDFWGGDDGHSQDNYTRGGEKVLDSGV